MLTSSPNEGKTGMNGGEDRYGEKKGKRSKFDNNNNNNKKQNDILYQSDTTNNSSPMSKQIG